MEGHSKCWQIVATPEEDDPARHQRPADIPMSEFQLSPNCKKTASCSACWPDVVWEREERAAYSDEAVMEIVASLLANLDGQFVLGEGNAAPPLTPR